MANIIAKIAQIRAAILGIDVRESIASGIESINTEVVSTTAKETALETTFEALVINAGSDNAEIVVSRGSEASLPDRLSQVDMQLYQIANIALPLKVDKITGKGLSTNDYDNTEKTEVAKVVLKANIVDVNTQIASVTSGSPKGTYTTLAALQSAFPTGNTNIYVVTADGNWYYWNGAWTAGGAYQSTGIAEGSITPAELSFLPVVGLKSTNLLNKDTVSLGVYLAWNGGFITNAEWVTSDFIPAEALNDYITDAVNFMAFWTPEKVFISYLETIPAPFATPANTGYFKVCYNINVYINGRVNKGTILLPYETYTTKLDIDTIKDGTIPFKSLDFNTIQGMMVVAKTGSYYKTINDAVEFANDSASNPVTIRLMPGTYVESVRLIGRYITIVGENKDTCIIKTYTNSYYAPPIDLGPNSNVYNCTIIADDDGVTTPPGGVDGISAYAIHSDIGGRGFDTSLTLYQGTARIKNCILISKHNQGAGIGISNGYTLIWEDCEFVAYGVNAAFRVHSGGITDTIQRMMVRNCIMHNDGIIEPICTQDIGGDAEFTFINNVAWNETNGHINNLLNQPVSSGAGFVSGYIKLGKGSFGNSIPELNAAQ